jgi:type VI secretion system secreted protein VgrG
MAAMTKPTRPMEVLTPLGKDVLTVIGFSGQEGISQLFRFQLDLVADNTKDVPFEKVLGQPVLISLELGGGKKRYWSGLCCRFSQGERDTTYTGYQMEVAPRLWLLTKRSQCRIFQQQNIPDILKAVLTGLDVDYQIQGGFHPRDYCVQYCESDFNFASRLMEEEGIFYFFKHSDQGHKMVVANTPQSHPDLPQQSKILYEKATGGPREEYRIHNWVKDQEVCSGKYTLWDHHFELPNKRLGAEKVVHDSVPVGKVTHQIKLPGSEDLEVYDYPGGYAQRFVGVDKGGADQSSDLQKVFKDNARTVEIRMQAEAIKCLTVRGAGNGRHLVSGHKFTLERHFNADGQYVVTTVRHFAKQPAGRSDGPGGAAGGFTYQNQFTCIPLALPYRPPLVAREPIIQGTQTATVVGPPGPEEIFTDKYGRVKIQFHWDRQGKRDHHSSCWVRVGTSWAGKGWGIIQLPRIGQEVLVAFMEGDPDRPIIIGSSYNAEQMPAFPLPESRKICGMVSKSNHGDGYNQFTHDDTRGKEVITVHAQKDMKSTVEHDLHEHVLHDRTRNVDRHETIGVLGNRLQVVGLAQELLVGLTNQRVVAGWMNEFVGGCRTNQVNGYRHEFIIGWKREDVIQSKTVAVRRNMTEKVGGNLEVTAKGDHIQLTRGASTIVMKDDSLVLTCGQASITLHKKGNIDINGRTITTNANLDAVFRAAGEFDAQAKEKATLEGSQFVINATQGMGSVTANTIVEVKGKQVQINC